MLQNDIWCRLTRRRIVFYDWRRRSWICNDGQICKCARLKCKPIVVFQSESWQGQYAAPRIGYLFLVFWHYPSVSVHLYHEQITNFVFTSSQELQPRKHHNDPVYLLFNSRLLCSLLDTQVWFISYVKNVVLQIKLRDPLTMHVISERLEEWKKRYIKSGSLSVSFDRVVHYHALIFTC